MITRESVQAADGTSFPGISFQKNALKPIFDLQKVYYYRVFIEVTKAHVVMLREQDLMTEDECALILSTMLDLEKLPIEESEYNPAYEDLFFLFEKELENRVGSDLAGKVHTARSRNDICVGEFRMVLREQLAGLAEKLNLFRESLLYVAGENLETIMPAGTAFYPGALSAVHGGRNAAGFSKADGSGKNDKHEPLWGSRDYDQRLPHLPRANVRIAGLFLFM